MVLESCDVHSPPIYSRRFRNFESIDLLSCPISSPEDLISDAGQYLPTDHAPLEHHLGCEAFSLVRLQFTHSSARVSFGDGFSCVSDELVDDMRLRTLTFIKDVVFLGDMGVYSLSDGSHICISLAADEKMVWQAQFVLAREFFSRSERVSDDIVTS